jgi:pyridine nucleotide-disulfide oxidoreductase family protein
MTRLLLAGGGHAHAFVLRELARRRPSDLEVMLVTPYERQLYSGMLPGWIAGHYAIDEFAIPLQPLAQAAGAAVLIDRIVGIAPAARRAITARGTTLEYDYVSLATGSDIAMHAIDGAQRWALPLRPLEDFVARWSALAPRLAETDRPKIGVIGGGAGGVEVALAVAYAMRAAGNGTQVQLVSGGALLPGHGERARALVREALVRSQVRLIDSAAVRIDSGHIDLGDGTSLPSDLTLLACGACAPAWLRPSGLALDTAGFVQVDRHLRSVSHDSVFAAGDIATIIDAPRARSGVYAVRAGPPLADNLIRRALGQPLRRHTPQRLALYLLATGRQNAIASWNGMAWSGDWVWRWKNRIDTAFIAGFRPS